MTVDSHKDDAAELNEAIDPWDLESAKPCTKLRHASAEALEMLGFVYDATVGRWVIPQVT
jgi:hypothetical protein